MPINAKKQTGFTFTELTSMVAITVALFASLTTYKIAKIEIKNNRSLSRNSCLRQRDNRVFIQANRNAEKELAGVVIAALQTSFAAKNKDETYRILIQKAASVLTMPDVPSITCK